MTLMALGNGFFTEVGIALNPELAGISRLFIQGAMLFYTAAFLSFAFHLSRLASLDKAARQTASKLERAGIILLGIAAVIHGVGVVLRGISASRVPWANMYEFSITGSFVVVAIFLIALKIKDIRLIATFVAGFNLLILGTADTVFWVKVQSLMPALQSYWLVIHVLVAVLATAFFNIAAALSIAYVFKTAKWVQASKVKVVATFKRILDLFPDIEKMERLAYRFNIIGFILWSFTLIAGAIWAERAWHRYWGWDTKEVWTFIIWTIYAGYLHANATRGWTGKRSAWLSIVGFLAILFNFTIVNLYFKGMHVYSGL
ncbi:c-type cytochrome biogenesis protein CcsB [Rhodoluna limnophila]|uniref:c-type cytochrome biogenesis protein CcsB n=1 Tax=Rhodoluna limnophila TaxID=232537 RepID=UPI001FE3CE9E|nr:c-type cytochrome biogenesis protein CcsB [Rhodoluna limnophila]